MIGDDDDDDDDYFQAQTYYCQVGKRFECLNLIPENGVFCERCRNVSAEEMSESGER